MGKVFISKCVFANFILVYITYVTSFIIMCPVGTTLQRFEIIDAKLDSVTEYVINDVYPVERQRRDSMVMELNIKMTRWSLYILFMMILTTLGRGL